MQKLLFSISIIAFGLIIGYIIQRIVLTGKIKADKSLFKQRKFLQSLSLLCLSPIATIGAIWIISFKNINIVFMPVIGAIAIFTGGFTALIIGKLLKLKPKQAGAFFSCGSMFNLGSIGALVVFIFLGEKAFALVPMYTIFEIIIYYTIWFPIAKSFSPNVQQEVKSRKLLKIVTDPFVLVAITSIIIGLFLNILKIPRPAFYRSINSIVIPLVSLLLLISIGMAMKFSKIKGFIKPALIISGIKFLLVPFVATGIAYLMGFGKIDNGLPLKVIIIISSMPVGFTALVPPSIYNLDIDLANAGWLVTTSLLIVVIPLQMLMISFI
ncbi:MAG: hypothetical protein JJE21_11125 [Spirochaetaceae bacterium]|nr:hypothetical protein [Spirochaetaceae bacterium]